MGLIGKRDEAERQESSLLKTIAAALAGIVAMKLTAFAVTTAWRIVTREEPPEADEPTSVAKKAAWIALIAGATGAARQIARDYIKPPSEPT